MKQFTRTLAGKTLLFLLCMAMVTLTLASAFLAMLMLNGEFYTHTEEELMEKYSYNIVRSAAHEALSDYEEEIEDFRKGNKSSPPIVIRDTRNLVYQIVDGDRVLVETDNINEIEQWKYEFPVFVMGDRLSYPVYSIYPREDGERTGLTVRAALVGDYTLGDRISMLHTYLGILYSLKYGIYIIGLVSALLAIASYIALLNVSAQRKNSEDLHPGVLNQLPFDFLLLFDCAFWVLGFSIAKDVINGGGVEFLFFGFLIGEVFLAFVLGLSMSAAARIKQGSLFKNTLIYKFCLWISSSCLKLYRLLCGVIRPLGLMPRTIAALVFFFFLDFIILQFFFNNAPVSDSSLYFYWFWRSLFLFLIAAFCIYSADKLRKGASELAKGDLNYKIDMKGLYFDFKEHAKDLNRIAKGMEIAVQDGLKSEKMKTELITNVSHDIKTPLTSIINYSSLISEALIETEPDVAKIREYGDVLSRQSDRLKKLIEDLVEASKANTGNIELNLEASDAALFLNQVSGEYADRLGDLGLTPITNTEVEEGEVFIMADSRSMLRIFENVMNNICKYALSGTRVYLGLEASEDRVVFSFKNTSRDALNIDASELFERFTRGDRSRSSEGNGLGLAIAKSLTELQGGLMDVVIDGDLFKLRISFPRVIGAKEQTEMSETKR